MRKQQNIHKKDWLYRIIGFLLLILLFPLPPPVQAAPGDILYENDFSSNSDDSDDWTRDGSGSDFQVSTTTYNSSPMSLRIRDESGGSSNSGLIDASSTSGVDVSFWLKNGPSSGSISAPESGDDLEFYYMNSSSSWVLLATYAGADAAGTEYTESFSLPSDALHNDLRFRFNMVGGSDWDHWYIDDFEVTETGTSTSTNWGDDVQNSSSYTISNSRSMGGTSPSTDNMEIDSISI
ncbi:MAG: hypothetical protein GY808_17150, partial [Gammaproteobacteria bacterium]|nr:hypothetical protein [Gammaproteobacteria bacterium]